MHETAHRQAQTGNRLERPAEGVRVAAAVAAGSARSAWGSWGLSVSCTEAWP